MSVDTLTTDTVIGGWVKIPLSNEVNFYTDTAKNILFQFTLDTGGSSPGCFYPMSRFSWSGPTSSHVIYGSKNGNFQKSGAFWDFGFDLYPNPADVKSTQNITDLRIYPNPSSGRFIISMAAAKMVKDARLSVSDMSGRVLWQQQYENIDDNFYQHLDLSEYPKGIYIAELRADGERLTRKMVVQ